ncbi:testis-expressed protein 12 [Centrocercus urophasianus]|uniref:testis-expressed protein 12 n=1 Tax=Centrocercus urophasianus TaxID=9002 RepID=UPI001C6511AE|nr:testis-expressed protein 12 [Centrocercus urophasianus]
MLFFPIRALSINYHIQNMPAEQRPCFEEAFSSSPSSFISCRELWLSEDLRAITMTSSVQKPDESRSKRRKELEADDTESPQLSSADTADPALSDGLQSLYKPEPLEELLNEMNKEIKNLLAKYAHILSERAAMDASYVQELDGILKEARTIENHLKQKKESLKQRFAMIANTLQS